MPGEPTAGVTTKYRSSLSQRFSQLINFRIYRRLTIKVMSDEKKAYYCIVDDLNKYTILSCR